MTRMLEEALAQLSKLPEAEQDAVGAWLLEELGAENRWEKLFAESSGALENLADQALAEHYSGRTEELAPDAL